MSAIDIRRVLLPKRDAAPRECEDWIAVSADRRAFAVADGATEGLDSRRWARLLTRTWAGDRERGLDAADLAVCVRDLGDRVAARWAGRSVPWYLEEKAASGAFAAFVGVEVEGVDEADDPAWTAVALGDCCLFVEEEGRVAESFPATSSAEFGVHPTLLPSNHARYGDFAPLARTAGGPWRAGARLVLLSDAIAAWWFDEHARGGAGVREIHAALDRDDGAAVAAIVAAERAARRMRNDDVAILRVERRG